MFFNLGAKNFHSSNPTMSKIPCSVRDGVSAGQLEKVSLTVIMFPCTVSYADNGSATFKAFLPVFRVLMMFKDECSVRDALCSIRDVDRFLLDCVSQTDF